MVILGLFRFYRLFRKADTSTIQRYLPYFTTDLHQFTFTCRPFLKIAAVLRKESYHRFFGGP